MRKEKKNEHKNSLYPAHAKWTEINNAKVVKKMIKNNKATFRNHDEKYNAD